MNSKLEELVNELDLSERKRLSLAARRNISRAAKRSARKRQRTKERREKKKKSPEQLEQKARKKARQILMKKMIGEKPLSSLTPQQKATLSDRLDDKESKIERISRKILPKIKKQEKERLKKVRNKDD